MSSAKGIRAGRAFVEFFADKSPFVRGLKSMEKDLKSWGARIAGIGAGLAGIGTAVVAAFAPAVVMFAKLGDITSKMSQRTGAAAESLSVLKYAAESAGTSIEAVEGAMSKVRGDIAAVAMGNYEAAQSYAKLGISIADLAKLKPEDQFALLADRISQIRNPTLQAALAVEVLGGSAEQMLPLLKQGAAGLAAARDRAKELGIVMDGKAATAGEALTQIFYDLTSSVRGLWNQVAVALAPELTQITADMIHLVSKATAWVRNNQQLAVTVAKVAVVTVALGTVITAVGSALAGIGFAFQGAAIVAAGFSVAMLAAGKAIVFFLGPAGMVARALVAGTVAFFKFTDAGQSAAKYISDAFADLGSRLSDSWSGITSAIWSGDFQLAAKIAFLTVRSEWESLTGFLYESWASFASYFVGNWESAVATYKSIMIEASAAVQSAWIVASTMIANGWDSTMTYMANLIQSAGILEGLTLVTEAWDAMTQFMAESWEFLKTTVANGWQFIQLGWQTAVDSVYSLWNAAVDGMSQSWAAFIGVIEQYLGPWAAIVEAAIDRISDKFTEVVNYIKGIWKTLTETMVVDFRGAQNFIAKGLIIIQSKIDGTDPTEQLKALDDQTKALRAGDATKNAERNQALEGRVAERNQAAQAGLAGVEAGRNQSQSDLAFGGLAGALKAGGIGGGKPGQSETQAKLDAALEEAFQAARKQKIAALELRSGRGDAAKSAGGFDPFAGAKQSISGGFQAAAVSRLSGTGDPQLTELRQVNKGIQQLVKKQAVFT